MERKNQLITKIYDGEALSLDDVKDRCRRWAEQLRPYARPTEQIVQDRLADGKRVLLEGAQGTLLDLDHGSYPYVTSSSPSIGGACTGLGLNPQAIKGVLGVFKAYSTRVGGGPMPSEMDEATAERIREIAQEYGTTTGRARRIGWFDGVAAKYSQLVNGFTGLVLTRLDILDGFESVKICVGYRADGQEVSRFPANTSLLSRCEPGVRGTGGLGRTDGQRHQAVPASRQRCDLCPPHRRDGRMQGADSIHRPQPRRDNPAQPGV